MLERPFDDGPRQTYLVTAAYHTPNGYLHLGHLGGPFLSADVLARHLETHGHRVLRITATDAFEPYVLLTAIAEGRGPEEVASAYYDSAEATVRGFDLHQDVFLDLSAPRWAEEYRRRSVRLAQRLAAAGRFRTRDLRLARSARSGRYLVGPFALGRCPACGSEAAGSSCEACGLWFPPDELREVAPRLADDRDPEWATVPTRFLLAAPAFRAEEAARRFPGEYMALLEAYLAHNGPWLCASQPLDWGVRWDEPDLPAQAVHVSYGLGSTVAAELVAEAYDQLTGEGSPFAASSPTTTVLTAGHDAVLPCMFLMATMDVDEDRQPFDHHLLNRFMLLDAEKFSTSRGHVITGPDYLDAGLPTDPFRLYAATIRSPAQDADFRPVEFARFSERLHERLGALLRCCAEQDGVAPREPSGEARDAVARVLREQALALALPIPDLHRGAEITDEWLAAGEAGLARSAGFWWCRTLLLLMYPYMPRWSEAGWRGLGGLGAPTLDELVAPRPAVIAWPEAPPPVGTARLAGLRPGTPGDPDTNPDRAWT